MKNLVLIVVTFMFFALTNIVSAEPTPKKIVIYMTVDWEGISLEQENIEAMQAFRRKFPHIPMLQLLNPVYFTREANNKAQITTTIKSTFLPNDTHGLHVHGWQSLMRYCDVTFQASPSYAADLCESGDCGYTVSLEYAYSEPDLTKLVGCSCSILEKNGFQRPKHFRAGGWQLGKKLSAALEKNGFVWDSSRMDGHFLTSRWHEESGLVKMVGALHPDSLLLDQPYLISKSLMEYPNNASLADYTSTKQIVEIFKNLIAQHKYVMVLGFHQETAADFLERLEIAIPKMEAIAKQENVVIEWHSQ